MRNISKLLLVIDGGTFTIAVPFWIAVFSMSQVTWSIGMSPLSRRRAIVAGRPDSSTQRGTAKVVVMAVSAYGWLLPCARCLKLIIRRRRTIAGHS